MLNCVIVAVIPTFVVQERRHALAARFDKTWGGFVTYGIV